MGYPSKMLQLYKNIQGCRRRWRRRRRSSICWLSVRGQDTRPPSPFGSSWLNQNSSTLSNIICNGHPFDCRERGKKLRFTTIIWHFLLFLYADNLRHSILFLFLSLNFFSKIFDDVNCASTARAQACLLAHSYGNVIEKDTSDPSKDIA